MNDNNKQVSAMSIVALILSIFCLTSLIGVALGIADLRIQDGRNHTCSIIAVTLGSITSIIIIVRIVLVVLIEYSIFH